MIDCVSSDKRYNKAYSRDAEIGLRNTSRIERGE